MRSDLKEGNQERVGVADDVTACIHRPKALDLERIGATVALTIGLLPEIVALACRKIFPAQRSVVLVERRALAESRRCRVDGNDLAARGVRRCRARADRAQPLRAVTEVVACTHLQQLPRVLR